MRGLVCRIGEREGSDLAYFWHLSAWSLFTAILAHNEELNMPYVRLSVAVASSRSPGSALGSLSTRGRLFREVGPKNVSHSENP